jgi:hypothetical protein
VKEGVECVENVRARFDGEKRNPWDEPEYGHHYARAMSAWSTVVAMSGFLYDGAAQAVVAVPKIPQDNFHCFWSTGIGWGTYSLRRQKGGIVFAIKVLKGALACRSCEFVAAGTTASVETGGRLLEHQLVQSKERKVITLRETLNITTNGELRIKVLA